MRHDRRLFNGKIQSSIVYPECFPISSEETVVNLGCGLAPQAVVYKGSFKKMIGVDLSDERLQSSKELLAEHGVDHYETICAPVETTGLPSASFDKALAIDIIEHLKNPAAFLQEAHRLLKPNGELLLSVPAMHDHYTHATRAVGRLLGRKTQPLPYGHPDAHNSNLSARSWMAMIRATPFEIMSVRASTLWPPLHLYGVPRFWFTNPIIHGIDRMLCTIPGLKFLGQACLIRVRKTI